MVRTSLLKRALFFITALLLTSTLSACKQEAQQTPAETEPPHSVKGTMQPRPGAPMAEVEVAVHKSPTDLPIIPAKDAQLQDDDLILGVEKDGQAVAFPVRFLAMYEIVDSQVGDLPVAPTW